MIMATEKLEEKDEFTYNFMELATFLAPCIVS
jgi:hypothetical protein